jgi:MYXO-CTERM domain-containing protein
MRARRYRQFERIGTAARPAAACAFAVSALLAAPALAQVPSDCDELGVAITEHSCFHSEFGPFDTVMATAGSELSAATPDIDAVHTEYRIGLTGEYSVVTYTPKRSGAWAVLLGKDVPLAVLAGRAEALDSILDQKGTTGCGALPLLHVFELTAATKYRFVFGPTAERTVVAVVEYIDDFLTQHGRDDDGDGFGGTAEVIVSPCKSPGGFAPNTRDCDDTDPLINPGIEEICDGIDQNCNGIVDDVGLVCRLGAGACRAQGTTVCTAAGSAAICSATPLEGSEETCNGIDDDCNGKIDDAGDLCTDPDRPTCVRSGRAAACGCRLDVDCGELASGRICNQETGACEDGCSPLAGGNGCGAGEVCDALAARCEPDTGAGAGGGEGGSAGGDATSSGSGGVFAGAPSESGVASSEGGESGGSASEASGNKEGGCGCRVAGQQRSHGAALSFLGLALALACRRRRVRAYLASTALAASSLVACGGRTQDVTVVTGGSSTGASSTGASSTGASSTGASGGSPASSGGEGGAAEALPDCVPKLGEKLIAHACTHTTNGPFLPAVAGGDAEPPDVSDLHRTYEVQIAGSGARLRYRAQREGTHAFMTDAPAALELWSEGKSLGALPSFAVEGCSSLTSATVFDLQRGAEYELTLLESPTVLNLFVEHSGAFGADAWQQACDYDSKR